MNKKHKKKNLWFKEKFTEDEIHFHRLKKYIIKTKTKYQNVILADTYSFGRCLILDGEIQSAQLDEFIYHEALVHPVMVVHPEPKEILILGGGEGATLREVLKYKDIKKITIVDIDKEVIEFCKKYLKAWHQGSFDNLKVDVIIGDAREYILTTEKKFDIIISDLPSPIKKGPAYLLYTLEFYKKLIEKLNEKGIFVLQACSGNLLQIKVHSCLYNTLKIVFKYVFPYYVYVPSFDVPWAFFLCNNSINPLNFTKSEILKCLKQKMGNCFKELKFYDETTHIGLFNIPKYFRVILEKEKKIITEKAPLYFYK